MVLRHRCRTRGAMVLAGALALAACAPLVPGPGAPVDERPGERPAPPPPAEPEAPVEAPSPPASPVSPPVAADAVSALVGDARRAAAAGRHEAAVALAERAQRLDPRAPEPYLVLARAHQALGRTAQARQLALRGLASSPPGSQLRADLEALLGTLGP